MDKKLTDKEILKALECCASGEVEECKNCPYVEGYPYCDGPMERDVLDLINRLQSKNKMLQERNVILNSLMIMQKSEDEKLVGNIDRLKEQFENSQKTSKYWKSKCEELVEELETAKAEAYKEFAERFKKAKQYSIERHENIVPVAVIDWILKELVGEDNAEEKE